MPRIQRLAHVARKEATKEPAHCGQQLPTTLPEHHEFLKGQPWANVHPSKEMFRLTDVYMLGSAQLAGGDRRKLAFLYAKIALTRSSCWRSSVQAITNTAAAQGGRALGSMSHRNAGKPGASESACMAGAQLKAIL